MLLTESLLGSSTAAAANPYVEDVFSTYLYTGTGTTQSISNSIQLGNGATTAGWIATLGGSGSNVGQSVAVDGSGNVYAFGYSTASGSNDFLLAKYNSTGALQWQRAITTSGVNSDIGQSVAVDSSGNIYICGYSDVAGSVYLNLIKLDTSGVIQWQRRLSGGYNTIGQSVAVDSSGNAYVCGYTDVSGTGDFLIAKYNTSGVIQWQRRLSSGSTDEANSIAVDSSGNVYVCGRSNSSGDNDFQIAKYDTSGTIQWQRRLGDSSNQVGTSIAVDSSGNVYVCGQVDVSYVTNIQIAKYNTSGAIQWQRQLGNSPASYGQSVAVDSSSNVYVFGYSNGAGTNDFQLAKYNTSGVIQWQRRLGSSDGDFGRSVAVDSSGNIYVCGYSNPSGTNNFLLAKLPNDGTGIGSYDVGGYTYVYEASTLTDFSSSLTDAATTLTSATTTLTDAASTLTNSASALSSSSAAIPSGVGYGGLVWNKQRNGTYLHCLTDTARGVGNSLDSADTAANDYSLTRISAFNANGFTMGGNSRTNASGSTYVSWTFRKQAKFFDVVTWTGNNTSARAITHNLGSTPGAIFLKKTSAISNWAVYHRSTGMLCLNSTAAANAIWNGDVTDVNSSSFTVQNTGLNDNSATYVAYLFAHDAGGFGAAGTDNVISCGSFTKSAGVEATVTLGYEPQWLLFKRTDAAENWFMIDNMRGMTVGGTDAYLIPNLISAESNLDFVTPAATGFRATNNFNTGTYIYIAIRRGPMRTPTSGASVFSPIASSATQGTALGTGFPVDMQINNLRTSGYPQSYFLTTDRLRGVSTTSTGGGTRLQTFSTAAEASATDYTLFWNNSGFQAPNLNSGSSKIFWNFGRAPGFFDVVCYTGTGSATTRNHNLGAVPQMIILKKRGADDGSVGTNWGVYVSSLGSGNLFLNATNAYDATGYMNMSATSTTFTDTKLNWEVVSQNYVAYLFGTVAGVSKVGSYTGSGTTKQIDCGFTTGARFVLIKRTDSTGDWYVWDSARGIIAGNDPYALVNSANQEVTNTDYIDTYTAGFEISSTAPAAINASGGTFIFLAIA